jgi:uncharacterized membrane protein YvlD (DUF360 family)
MRREDWPSTFLIVGGILLLLAGGLSEVAAFGIASRSVVTLSFCLLLGIYTGAIGVLCMLAGGSMESKEPSAGRIHTAIIAAISAILLVSILYRNCPGSWGPVVYLLWPVLDRLVLPLDSGPNPAAGVWCLVIDAVILSVALYFALRVMTCALPKRHT